MAFKGPYQLRCFYDSVTNTYVVPNTGALEARRRPESKLSSALQAVEVLSPSLEIFPLASVLTGLLAMQRVCFC